MFETMTKTTNSCTLLDLRQAACQRCYNIKGKCQFVNGQLSCSSCYRLGISCRARLKKRMGRRPVFKGFTSGDCSIMSLTTGPVHVGGKRDLTSPDSHKQFWHAASSSLSDRRSINPALGIRPSGHAEELMMIRTMTLKLFSTQHPKIQYILNTKEGFFEAHRHFMVGPGFLEEFQFTVLLLFYHSPQILTDAYNALLHLMDIQKVQTIGLDKVDLTLGSRCLKSLRRAISSTMELGDAAATIMLGQVLLAYNALLPLGNSTRLITRETLWGIKDWYPVMHQHAEFDSIIIAPVLVDTIDCLIRREIPVIRFPTTDRMLVDRFSGVCSTLLPILYDLCECSYRVKGIASSESNRGSEYNRHDPYLEIEQRIIAWEPPSSPQLYAKYAAMEIAAMMSLARSYRITTLLIIHRLRYSLGTEDTVAHYHAACILEELSSLNAWPSTGATGLGLDFPLLVAMIEIPVLGEEIFRAFEPLRYRKRQSVDILEFVRGVAKARHMGYEGLWFDLVKDLFRGDILP